MIKCKICNSKTEKFDQAIVLKKYLATYYLCPNCGFIQTETPYWLNEAYSEAIVDSDIGLVKRNVLLNQSVSSVISLCLSHCQSFLDYGGGYGLFTRLMRDTGFDFEWFDKYCDNLFAKYFEKSKEHYDLITAFELFEHLENPIQEIQEFLQWGDNLLFTTMIVPDPVPNINNWWYYSPHGGQHISFYTYKSLQYVANQFQRYYIRYGDLHLFSKEKISQWRFSMAVRFSFYFSYICKKRSLLDDDYKKITNTF